MTKQRTYDAVPTCAIEAALNLINGRWKAVILFHLLEDGTTRFGALQRHCTGCTPRLLSKQLRELERDGFVTRTVYAVVPPKVEYALTAEGRTIGPILVQLCDWGREWLDRQASGGQFEERRGIAA